MTLLQAQCRPRKQHTTLRPCKLTIMGGSKCISRSEGPCTMRIQHAAGMPQSHVKEDVGLTCRKMSCLGVC